MASKKVGTLIKEARTEAGLTQEQLARRISGLSANDISLAERHQKNLTQDQLKQIAKIIGVDSLGYLSVDHVGLIAGAADSTAFCKACFDGKYPTHEPTNAKE